MSVTNLWKNLSINYGFSERATNAWARVNDHVTDLGWETRRRKVENRKGIILCRLSTLHRIVDITPPLAEN